MDYLSAKQIATDDQFYNVLNDIVSSCDDANWQGVSDEEREVLEWARDCHRDAFIYAGGETYATYKDFINALIANSRFRKVRESYRNSGNFVFYDEDTNAIWICFGEATLDADENVLTLTECSQADVGFGEYDGDILANTRTFRYKDDMLINSILSPV